MVYTLHRYIFIDLIKKFSLALLVLSMVMGLGMMLKPLRDFNIDPMKVPTLIACTMPITVTMVLPIAALLATTLTYGRLAFDNEINACRSSGISIISLLYPAGTLALLIGLASLLLGFHTIPYFISRFESIVSEDAESMIFRGIEKKGEISKMFSGMVIRADHVWPEEHILQGVTLVTANDDEVKQVVTAKAVKLNIKKNEETGENRIILKLGEAKGLIDDAYVGISRNEFSVAIPTMFKDKIKFKNLDELKEISANLGSFGPIRKGFELFEELYLQELLYNFANSELQKNGYVFMDCDNGYTVRIFAGGCVYSTEDNKGVVKTDSMAELLPLADGEIVVEYSNPDSPAQRKVYTCDQAKIKLQNMFYGSEPRAVLSMKNVTWQTGGGSHINVLNEFVTGIIVPSRIISQAKKVDINEFSVKSTEEIVPGICI